ncbi:RHS repeat-associated core domain-containing protein [Amycolatopsis sp. NPDC051903]|uniref:RHS repeat-associated core domain-containing protein n=2 Tax=Amycolatopsis sp. NPDC051903 TaxID=3363936 RepID=UPI0037AC9E07
MSNPLIAPTEDSTKAYSGISLLETANDLSTAIESGDWASVAMGAVGTALDALSMAMDPFGAILAAGVSWLMEHVGPLKDALNGLTGNADQIKAQSETWANVAKELGSVASDLNSAVMSDLQSWSGDASDAYRQRAQDLGTLLQSAQKGCEGASSGVKTAGEVVAAVRTLVRDIISELVGHLISWALQVLFTLGIGLAWVVPQVISAVAKTASQITSIVTKLVKALKALIPLLKKAGTLFEDAAKALKNIKGGKVSTAGKGGDIGPMPKDPPKPAGSGGGTPKGGGDGAPPPAKSGGDDSTHSSSAGGGGSHGGGDTPPPPAKSGGDDATHASGSGGGDTPPPPPKSDPPPPAKTEPEPPPAPAPKGLGSDPGTPKSGGGTPKGSPNKPSPPRDRAVGPDKRVCESDPIDVATGEMVLEQVDLVLPLDLELSLQRTHVSSYHAGRWFGRSWASTVDQRLEVDDEDVCYFAPDGVVLVYPLPAPGTTTLPVEGPRLPLTRRLDGGYVLGHPQRDTRLRFDPVPGERAGVLPLTAVTGAEQRLDVEYDEAARPLRIRHSDGFQVEFTTTRDRVTAISVVDPDAGVSVAAVRYGYDADGRLSEVVNSSDRPMQFDYDTQGRVTGWQDRNGTWYRYVYDAAGRCVKTVGDKGFRDGTFAYDRERRVTAYTDSLGRRTEYHLNEANQVVREVDPAGGVTTSTWDRYDRLLTRTDPLGRTTAYEYDETGALGRVVRPDGSVVQVHLRAGAVAAISVRDGERTWTRTYDEAPDPFAGQLGTAEAFRHDSGTSASVLPDAVAEAGRSAKTSVPDMFGRPALVETPGGRVRLDWTVEGRRAARVGAAGGREQWTYDPEGNDVAHVNEIGAVTRREYGPFDVVVAAVDETGARTTYTYDTELRLASVTNPVGLTWRYVRDHAGRVVEERDFDGRTLRFEYDAVGRLTRAFNGLGELTEHTYDTLGNLVGRRTPHGLTTYSYDPVGRLRRAENGDAVIEYERDERGRVIAQTTNGRTTTFAYAPDGTRVHRRTPSGVDSVWSFGDGGAPIGLAGAGHVLSFTRDAAGKETGRTVDGAVVLTQQFDAEQRLAGQETAALQRRYGYRPDGHLVRTSDNTGGGAQFQLDAAGRVVEVVEPDRREGYRYDPAGNIVSVAAAGAPAPESGPRSYAANSLTAAGVLAYRYDAQGRVVQRRVGALVWNYGWDAQDRMTGVTTPDGTRWRYRYDPVGRRIAKQRLGPGGEVAEQADFVWDGAKLVEETHRRPDGTIRVRTWDYDPDSAAPLTQHESAGGNRLFHTIVTDPVGRPTELLDASGRLGWRGRTTVWGRDLPGGGDPTATPLRFPGQYFDAETGLHYNVYRYYDPATGRYVSQDPLGLAPAPNPVAYVRNPLRVADPLGLAPTSCSEIDLGESNRPGSSHDPAHVGDTGSTANPSRSSSPGSESEDITDQAAPPPQQHQPAPAGPDFSHNPPSAPDYVYHGSGAPPDKVFSEGLTSDAIRNNRPPIYDIDTHQHRSYGSGSGYVSTSGNYNTGVQFVPIKPNAQVTEGADWWGKGGTQYHGHDGYVYTIKGDANTMVHLPSHPDRVPAFDGQDEWAAVDHIPGSQIVGANKISGNYNVQPFGAPGQPPTIVPAKNGIQSTWIPNPDFQG